MTLLTENKDENIQIAKKIIYDVFKDHPIVGQLAITQAILESDFRESLPHNKGKGGSELAVKYNNLFGIKGRGTVGKVPLDTEEYKEGKIEKTVSDFAWNKSVEDSVNQYKRLLENGTSGRPDRYRQVFNAKNILDAAKTVGESGYSTNPRYASIIASLYYSMHNLLA